MHCFVMEKIHVSNADYMRLIKTQDRFVDESKFGFNDSITTDQSN